MKETAEIVLFCAFIASMLLSLIFAALYLALSADILGTLAVATLITTGVLWLVSLVFIVIFDD